ncbi:thermonuclease family protein [Oceanobacillus sp. FSL K6-2867]|uniref:thermonuclease family protein n=1 Tax=Oceanobacillus sp. FSL K6-2867 TaxID=2954748 RepID=UPI0030DCF8CA
MGSKKEKKPSIEELARKRIANLYMYEGKELLLFCDAAIKGKSMNVFAALDSNGITLYEYKETYENKIVKLETHNWDEWDKVQVDHYFIKSTFEFGGSNENWSVSIGSKGKEVQQVINSYTDIKIETTSRPWYRKIVGFRSWKTWKMITAILIYAILVFSIIDTNTSEKTDEILATVASLVTFLAFLGLLIGLVIPKYVLPFTMNKHRKRVGKIYGTSVLLAFLMVVFFAPVQPTEHEHTSEVVKTETTSKGKAPVLVDATNGTEDEDKEVNGKNEQNKVNQNKDDENKDTNNSVAQPVASTSNKPKSEEQSKSPSGVVLTSAFVNRVVDGDTIKVQIDGKEETVRLILVDTPETKHPQLGVQPFGPEASAYTENALNGKKIDLEKDVSDRDKYGRLLRYVWVDGELFNQQLIEKGLARVAIYQPDVKYVDQFSEKQQKAQQEGIGIWSIENYAQEDGYRTQEEKPVPTEAPKPQPKEEPKTTSGSCNIKGNISSSGENIYHVPGGQFYEVTNPEQTFCSTAEAESAGYRASKR